jgi:DNA helicase IV
LINDLRDAPDVRREVNLAWMPLSPQQVIDDLLSSTDYLREAAPQWTDDERHALLRPRSSAWTVADIPLLDEAAELLGADDEAERRAEARLSAERAHEAEYAQAVLEMTGTKGVSAEQLIERYAEHTVGLTVAERASSDREWVFGHVVVDEAQEWADVLRGLARPRRKGEQRWRVERLTINYRTPRPFMELAQQVLRDYGRIPADVTSIRDGEPPEWSPVGDDLIADIVDVVLAELKDPDMGRLAVIADPARTGELTDSLTAATSPGTVGRGADRLDAPVSVVSVAEAKGLEFDVVVVADPRGIADAAAQPGRDLYVALTRATRRLIVAAETPEWIDGVSAPRP